jgi:ribosomal protein S18 acetylase RimI-like enzyme
MAYDWQARKIKLLTSHGYMPARYFDEIERDLCDPIASCELPNGITVRTYEDAPLSDSLLVHNVSFTDHWGSQPISESRWRQKWNEFHVATASFVAYDGDEPVSYLTSAAFPHDFKDKGRSEAWVEGLGTVRSHRKRGIASTLVTLAIEDFKRLGMEYAVLGVDSESPTGAHHLYESLGFVHHRREIAYIKKISIEPYL